jgi:uncharacterized cofD-like protein
MDQNRSQPLRQVFRKLKKIRIMRWLTPGLGIKRWMIPIVLGTSMIGFGLAIIILGIYRSAPGTWWLPVAMAASLALLDRTLRAIIFGVIGIGLVVWGIQGMNRAFLAPFTRPGKPVLDELSEHRRKDRGPRIVAIGGGHGLATLLRGLKRYTTHITAVVTVADDGGSSGRLRRSLGVLPPGDIRNCLAALSSDEALMTQLFQYRFTGGDDGLQGHSFGNLFISALAELTGSFEEAVAESGRVLAVHGRVLPATLNDVQLVADVILPQAGSEVRVIGESQIPDFPGQINRVWLEPNNPPAYPAVIQALLSADLIVIGPGSLFTSILPDLLVPDISAAILASRALKIYVCNVATQKGETDGYSCHDHARVLMDHVGGRFFDLVLANSAVLDKLPEGIEWVVAQEAETDYAIHLADLVDEEYPWRHDSTKLSRVLMDLFDEKTGPLVE